MKQSSFLQGVAPKGIVLQVVSTTKTDTASAATGTGTWADISGLSVTLTPQATSSEVKLELAVMFGVVSADNTFFRILRGATVIGVGDANGVRERVMLGTRTTSTDAGATGSASGFLVDSPATISPVTYKVQWTTGTTTGYLNRNSRYGNNTYDATFISSLIASEVAG